MRTIRKNVFETNSSSIHSIAIPKDCDIHDTIYFHTDKFGCEFEEVDPADYFYTAIYETSNSESEVNEKIEKLTDILDAHNIQYYFIKPKTHIYYSDYNNGNLLCLDYDYIDHGYELKDFVNELLNNGEKLICFLCGGLVFTGNDNADTYKQGFVNREEQYVLDFDWSTKQEYKIENPYYMDNHSDYEWYYKDN